MTHFGLSQNSENGEAQNDNQLSFGTWRGRSAGFLALHYFGFPFTRHWANPPSLANSASTSSFACDRRFIHEIWDSVESHV